LNSSATHRQINSPEDIKQRSGLEVPPLLLPDPGKLFAERALRLRQLAAGHAMRDYLMLMAVVCGLTAIVTNFMSNTATAALMAPLAVPIAVQGGVSPLPLLMGIAMSASACFLTPIATPPNTIVLGPGNYKFMDYFKAGWPLQIISYIMCVVFIPMIWKF